MKLAIPYEEGQIFQHFGKTPAFKIYDIANGQVGGSMVFLTGGQGHGALAGLLRALGIGAEKMFVQQLKEQQQKE